MSPRPDVSEERKHQILDAATEVFSRKGLDQTRMDDIVDEAGLSKGALYWYFKSKDDIILAIFDRMFQRELQELERLKSVDGGATERLWQFTDRTIGDLRRMLRWMPIAYEFFSLAFRQKGMQEAFKRYFNNYMAVLTPIIQQGIDSGEFRALDAQEVAIAAGAIFEGTILLWVYDRTLVDPEKHIRSGIQILLEGIVAPV